jgi:hypothetical protein
MWLVLLSVSVSRYCTIGKPRCTRHFNRVVPFFFFFSSFEKKSFQKTPPLATSVLSNVRHTKNNDNHGSRPRSMKRFFYVGKGIEANIAHKPRSSTALSTARLISSLVEAGTKVQSIAETTFFRSFKMGQHS